MNHRLLLACALALCLPAFRASAESPKTDPQKTESPKTEKSAPKTENSPAENFIRVRKGEDNRPAAMETSIVRYTGPTRPGVVVDLIGAIHIADQAYYDELNKLFEKYDIVLYELVAPEGTRVPKGGRKEGTSHPLGLMQGGMGSILELKHQLDCIDYTKDNLVHADMSPAEFSKTMDQRGESFLQMFLRMMGQGVAQSGAGGGMNDAALIMALFSPDRATKLKSLLAEQFQNLEGHMAVLDGPEGSTIITERNRKCLEVLTKQLDAGKKKIGIFYGAGHLPDMQRRLATDYQLHRTTEQWLTAWQLQQPNRENAK